MEQSGSVPSGVCGVFAAFVMEGAVVRRVNRLGVRVGR